MPVFEIDAGGKTFELDAPDMATASKAFQAYNGQASVPSAPSAPSDQGGMSADNLVRSAAQGIPVVGGLVDKFSAGMDALTQPVLGRGSNASTLSERYAQNAKAEAAHTQAFDTQHPVASTLAGLAGGTAALAPIAGTATGARMLGFGGGPLLGNVARGAVSGGAIGAADAAVRGQDPISGAEWGAGFGGAAPAAGRLIGGIASKISSPWKSPEMIAAQKVAAPLEREGLTDAQAVEGTLSSMGPEAMLVDANPELTQMGGAIAQSPGKGQQILRGAMKDRAAAAGGRIKADLDSMMGRPVDLNQMADQIHSDAQAKAGPLFERSYSVPIQSSPEMEAVLASPFGKAAMAKARELALSDTKGTPSVMFGAGPQATAPLPPWAQGVMSKGGQGADALKIALQKAGIGGNAQVDVRGLHLVRQAYDDMISVAKRLDGGNKLRILYDQRATLDKTLKSVKPFAQGDAIYSGQERIREAIAEGTNIFRDNRTPEDIAGQLAQMSEAAKEAYLQGARVAVRNVMGTARNNAAAARALFSKEFNQEKLWLAVGPKGSTTILNNLGAEQTFADSAQRIVASSETASRLLGKAELAGAHGLPPYVDVGIFSGMHGLVHRAVVGTFKNALEAVTRGRQQEIETSIAKLLTAKGVDRAAAIDQIMTHALKTDPSGKTNRLVAQVVARLPLPSDADRKAKQQ